MHCSVRGLALNTVLASMLMTNASFGGEEIKPTGRRIVGGEPTDIRQHPWQVALEIQAPGETYLCGGSIVAPKWLLTAAHCFAASSGGGAVRAKAGVTNYQSAGVWFDVERVVIHEGYNPKTQENDIALVKVKSPLAGRAIALPEASTLVPVGQPLEVTGWGVTHEKGAVSGELLKTTVPYVKNATCNTPEAYKGRIKEGMMCAGYRKGGADACQGDSGGPLVWKEPNRFILVGIVSFGEGCARKLKYGVYTRVSVYRNWIDRFLSEKD